MSAPGPAAAAAAYADGMVSPLLEKQLAMDYQRLETQMLQLTDLLCVGGGLLVLSLVFSSALAKECRRVLPYLLSTLAVVFLAAFWCIYQVGARQTGIWTTCVVAVWWFVLLRWGTFWVPFGHQVVFKSFFQPEPVVVKGPVLRFYLPFVYRRVPLLAPGIPPGRYVEVLCTARLTVRCGPIQCSSSDGYELTFSQADVTFSIQDASHWMAPDQTLFLGYQDGTSAEWQVPGNEPGVEARSSALLMPAIAPHVIESKLRQLFAEVILGLDLRKVEESNEHATFAWAGAISKWLRQNPRIDLKRLEGGVQVLYTSSVGFSGKVRLPRKRGQHRQARPSMEEESEGGPSLDEVAERFDALTQRMEARLQLMEQKLEKQATGRARARTRSPDAEP